MVTTAGSGAVDMPLARMTALVPSAAEGWMRALTGVSVSIGLGLRAIIASSTACMSDAACAGILAVLAGGGGGAALVDTDD